MKNIFQRYEDALEYFSLEGNQFAIQACKLGKPQNSNSIPTACLYWDENKKGLRFLFNQKFSETLTDEEFRFVLSHEAIHLMNNHIETLKRKLDEFKKNKQPEKETAKWIKKFNIAADCVVNDSLTNLYGFNKIFTSDKDKIKIVYGKDYVGQDCHDLTVMEVFYMLKDEQIEGEGDCTEHNWSSLFDESGNLKDEIKQQVKKLIQNNIENSNLSDEQLKNIEKMNKELEGTLTNSTQAGNMKIGNYRAVDNQSKIAVNWNKIFNSLVKKKKRVDVWNKVNNKLVSVYPDIILPYSGEDEKENIFIAIDASGSIDYKALSLFLTVVRNIPKQYKIKCISFDTECYDFDIWSGEKPIGGGGTRFDILSEYVDSNFKNYPICIVLTDGCGTSINPKEPKRWGFLLYGPEEKTFTKSMKNFSIKELLK